ncbi:hypothetical protein C4J81_12785 [Deltaproteobacteria bacterium Smac51]|nr:hypothetical protein C4J81_12785 [Deltaproteobacteria bacterium Smac51]
MTELAHEEKSLENLGSMLKTQREIHGMTRRDVVVKTKIPLEQLESIEDGRLSSLPPVFAKGFLRAYATELGLDAEAIVEDYRQMTGGFKNEPASREPLAPKYIETSVGSNMGPVLKFLMLLVLITAGLAAAFWFSPGFRATAISILPALEQLSPDAESPQSDAVSSEAEQEAALESPASPSAAPEAQAAPEQQILADAPIQPAEAAPAPVQPGGTLILTSTKDDIWTQVVVDGGDQEFYYFKAGQKVEFKARHDIVVTAGQASALSVNWNGQDTGPLAEGTVAEIRFPRS